MNKSIKAPEGIPTGAITEGERMSTDTRSAEERREDARGKWEQAGRAWFRRCYPSGTTTGYEYQEGKPYQEPAPPRNS